MELEGPKKTKHSKPRELSPPPPVLALDELEERFTNANERQPSTSGIGNEITTKKKESSEAEESNSFTNKENAAKLKEKPLIDSKEISNAEKTVECDEKSDTGVLSGVKKEESIGNIVSTRVPEGDMHPPPATFTCSSLMDSKETAKADNSVKDIASGIYPNMQLNEVKTASSQKVDEVSIMAHSERVREHNITDTRQSLPPSSKIQNEMNEHVVNIYPSLSLECNEYGLLTESQLLSFYQNELYETVEDFVDEFLEHEEFPQHNLYEYLERYKKVCEHIDANEIDVADCEQLVKECAQASWTAENRVIKQEVCTNPR